MIRQDADTFKGCELIKAAHLDPLAELQAQMLVALWAWERERQRRTPGKPLHELTLDEIIEIARGGKFASLDVAGPR